MNIQAVRRTLLCVSLCALPLQVAQAEERDSVTEMARQRFQEGVRFFDQKKYEEARGAFLQAYALKQHPAVLLNLAQSELRSGHPAEAAKHFNAYLRESSTPSASERAEAEKGLASARTKLARIQIGVAASGADIFIDGESVGRSPLTEPVDVAPGNHTVEARHAGHTSSVVVSAPAGRITTTTVPLAADAPATPLATASLPSPFAPAPLSPPSSQVEPPVVEPPTDSGVAVSTTAPGERQAFFPWLVSSPWGLMGGAVTVAGLGVYAGFGIANLVTIHRTNNVANQIREHVAKDSNLDSAHRGTPCANPTEAYVSSCGVLQGNLDQQDQNRKFATIGAIGAGAGAVFTVTAYLLDSKRPSTGAPPAAAVFVPVLGLDGSAGGALRGHF